MKAILSACALALALSAPAYATGKSDPKPQTPAGTTISNSAGAGAYSGVKNSGNSSSSSGVIGSGNSANKNTNVAKGGDAKQGQAQGQLQGQAQTSKNVNKQGQTNSQSTNVGGQKTSVGGQSSANNINIEGDDYEAAAYAPDVIANSTADCIKGYGISFGTVGATGGISLPMESGNCVTTQRTALIAALGGNETALLYLAQNDPALWATLVAQGKIVPAPRQNSNALRQSQMPQANIVSGTVATCYVKPGTKRTVVTNYADKMACARELGLAK